jgi:hypothetical protein
VISSVADFRPESSINGAVAMWKETTCDGVSLPFAAILPEDDWLHPVSADAAFDCVETNLYGFNIPEENIQCNIYVLWHPVLRSMSAHIFVYRSTRILPHQLSADYFTEYLFLPAVTDNRQWSAQLGSCALRCVIDEPLNRIRIECDDPSREFALRLEYAAALPPVGRPGGKHFTQLMKTSGQLLLAGKNYVINGHYMRDRSWGYRRPEEPERAPPYRWMTGWFGDDSGFVVAWLDTGLLKLPEFGPQWVSAAAQATVEVAGKNKWESGGPTPSLTLRSGWISVAGRVRPVVRMQVRTLLRDDSQLKVQRIELSLEDDSGAVHCIEGDTVSMIPKMYWGNLLTYMHFMRLRCAGRTGHGDLMDTYSGHHIRHAGL